MDALSIFELIVRVLFLVTAATAFILAREFGFLRKENGQTPLGKRLVFVFVALTWMGLITFMGGMVKVYEIYAELSIDFQFWRISVVRLVSIVPLMITLGELGRFVIRDNAIAYKVRRQEH